VAMQSVGITMVKGDLRGIAQARILSQATMRNIRENLFFAFVYKRSGGPSRRRGALSGVPAAVEPDHRQRGMSLSSVSVIGNTLRLRRHRPDSGGSRPWRMSRGRGRSRVRRVVAS
jgi:P-type Cu+ transporter